MLLRSPQPTPIADLGRSLAIIGRSEEALVHIEKAIQLSPRDPRLPHWWGSIAAAHFAGADYESAREAATRSIEFGTNEPLNTLATAYQVLAASQALLGRGDSATAALNEALRLRPNFGTEWVSLFYSTAEPEHRRRFLDGLRIAGLEE